MFKKAGEEKNAPAAKRIVRSEELFEKDKEIIIQHGEFQYRLQITRAGKLILNK